jgi:hypothetical protein
MKRLSISLFAALTLFGVTSLTAANWPGDTPECCQKHESCCPSGSCCQGGKHAECAMQHSHHHV